MDYTKRITLDIKELESVAELEEILQDNFKKFKILSLSYDGWNLSEATVIVEDTEDDRYDPYEENDQTYLEALEEVVEWVNEIKIPCIFENECLEILSMEDC